MPTNFERWKQALTPKDAYWMLAGKKRQDCTECPAVDYCNKTNSIRYGCRDIFFMWANEETERQ